ncbi:MAG: hypothetical protein ACREO3_11865 [Arenimonas sp.]
MRIAIAALLGGIVMFFWGFAAHMLLPLGDMGMKAPTNEDLVISATRDGLGSEGVYLVPWLGPEGMNDEARSKAYSAKAVASPYAFVVYHPQGEDSMQMGDNLGREFASNVIGAAIVAFVLSLGVFPFARRVMVAAMMGLFGWVAISVPYWNWYRFPLDFTLANLVMQVVGWTLAGAAMAWWLGRGERRT